MKKLTINHNGFHGLTSRTIMVRGSVGQRIELSEAQIKKLKRAACGQTECKCGESLLNADCFEIPAPWESSPKVFVTIPANETVEVRGNYPQG